MKALKAGFVFAIYLAGSVMTAEADLTGSVTITGCTPAGGITGYCQVERVGTNDDQQSHSMVCSLTEQGVEVDYFNGGDHPHPNPGTHDFPFPQQLY